VDDTREFVAETREEAIAKAESFFRVSADQLDTWVVPTTVTVSGLGGRVLLLAALRGARSAPREERRPERREPRREERKEERREERAQAPRREREETRARQERPPRERPARAERPAPKPAPVPEPVEDEGDEEYEEGELSPVGDFVAGILERMKLGDVSITEDETEDGDIVITLAGRSITALADREPRLAAALSHLAHRAAEALIEDEATARVDIKGARRAPEREERSERGERGRGGRRGGRGGGGGRERGGERRDSDRGDIDEVALERMAREAAQIVRDSGESELLRPMSSRERWVVHNALKDERGVRSESEGEGPRKRVRVVPA
jgi:predicted RNA-binding protein Jag